MENKLDNLSNLAKQYPASGIRKMFDLAAGYDNVINMTVGEPNFETPQYIKEAAKKAIDEGYTRYAPNAGLPIFRETVAKKYHSYWEGYTKDNVIITVGALEGMTLSILTLLNPGDEMIVPDPCFPNYFGQTMIGGVKAVRVPCYEENDFKIMAADIEKAITPKTRAILLNSPSNPLGSVLEKDDILAIAKVAKEHDLFVFSDEPYDTILYDDTEFYSIGMVDEIRDKVIIMNSLSKSYAMTGWRVGYLLADAAYIPKMAQIQEGMVSCVSTFSQMAGVAALNGPQDENRRMVKEYARRRDLLIDGLNAIPGITCKKSKGSFYAFANVKAFGKTSQEFAEEMIQYAQVVAVPGSAFGEMGEGYIRFVFANSDENIIEAVKRIDAFVREQYPDVK